MRDGLSKYIYSRIHVLCAQMQFGIHATVSIVSEIVIVREFVYECVCVCVCVCVRRACKL